MHGKNQHRGLVGLTAVAMKSSISWDITSCNPLKVIPRFAGTYRLRLLDL
jgi:uncharacterized protein YfaT (DUF1175 family)